jgi:dTDP-4-dehydrorhamnose reductase
MFLVTGANGQLGTALKTLLQDKAVYIDREALDLTDETAVKNYLADKDFDYIINCAAYTAVDRAEGDAENAHKVNALAPLYLAKYGKRIVHISTDYVFDGSNHTPYTEDETPHPVSVYGKTKREGEINILNTAETAIIIRTAWLYSPHGGNFVKTMRKLGSERPTLNVVFDQIGTPTNAYDLARAIVAILPQIKNGEKEIYHYTNEGVCSWYDFALEIMKQSCLKCQVLPIESKDYPTPAARPHYSVLNKAKIKQRFNLTIPHWTEGLTSCLKQF